MSDTHEELTVYLSTYNQEEFVAQALDSILMQKTTFKYGLLVADDCSTDKTQEIILDYQKRYPEIISTYFTPVNVGGCKKLVDCIDNGLFKGEYIAFLEGDDYWLEENRLQILVDFLERNPEYSRISHKRLVIDENNVEKGFDISDEVLNKPFYIDDFLAGRQYSDFGSVFRNYFKEAGNKYHKLLLASRNVCDFQDMFITQDFGPVYVMDKCLGVYRSRSIPGATNYNSIVSQRKRCLENIRLAHCVEEFYEGKYDLAPMIRFNQKRLLAEAVSTKDNAFVCELEQMIDSNILKELMAEQLYLALRGHRKDDEVFVRSVIKNIVNRPNAELLKYFIKRMRNKIMGKALDERVRGRVLY